MGKSIQEDKEITLKVLNDIFYKISKEYKTMGSKDADLLADMVKLDKAIELVTNDDKVQEVQEMKEPDSMPDSLSDDTEDCQT